MSVVWGSHLERFGIAAVTGNWCVMRSGLMMASATMGACSDDRLTLLIGPTAVAWHLGARCRVGGPRGGL
jgi:hypothetical protein